MTAPDADVDTLNGGGCHPALLVIERGGVDLDPLPHPDDVTDTVTSALENEGWPSTHDLIVDVRAGPLTLQDEVPPEPPITVDGVAVVLAQSELTDRLFPGVFTIVQDALLDAYGEDAEVWIDALEVSR